MPDPTPPEPTQQLEFNDKQSELVIKLAAAMELASLPLIVGGFVYLILSVMAVVNGYADPKVWVSAGMSVLTAVFLLVLGGWTRIAARSFAQIATTRGQDLTHLMNALTALTAKYSLLATLVIVYVLFSVIGLVVSLIVYFTRG